MQVALTGRFACPPGDWHAGVNFAVAAGWLEPASDTLIRLTQAGFDVMQPSTGV